MRKYIGTKLTIVTCNCCGHTINVENEIIKEGVVKLDAHWGFFSNKDGQDHEFDLCEKCYDEIVDRFKHPVNVTNRTEMI